MYHIISSGSAGNAVLYFDNILVDVGVPYSSIQPFIRDIQLVFISHVHHDHFNIETIRRIQFERPTVRFAVGRWMVDYMDGIKNIDILDLFKWYDYGSFKMALIKLYHDVETAGVRIWKDGKKIIHATDTKTLEGIEAKEYDLYAIESNYDAETIQERIDRKIAAGEFAYEKGSVNSHLSEQQCNDFFYRNRKEDSILVRLHESKNNSL